MVWRDATGPIAGRVQALPRPLARLSLVEYYAIVALNSMAAMLFLYCLYFWAKSRFAYSDTQNLLLGAVGGFLWIFAALYGGRLADRIGCDRQLLVCFGVLTVTLLVSWLVPWVGLPFALLAVFTLFQSSTWPALESAVVHVPGRLTVAGRVGLYNLSWALGGPVGYFLGGYLYTWNANSILWAAGAVYGSMALWLALRLGQRRFDPARETVLPVAERHDAGAVATPGNRTFMHFAWLANALGYLMVAAFMALVPHLGERLRLRPAHAIWLSSSFMFVRAAGFLLFWQWHGWLYNRRLGLAAFWAAPLCLGFIFFSTSLVALVPALMMFGLSLALSYSGSLYYSLNAADTKGKQGGLHEAIIGVGAFAGPLLGAAASMLPGGTTTGKAAIIMTALLAGGGGLLALHRHERW